MYVCTCVGMCACTGVCVCVCVHMRWREEGDGEREEVFILTRLFQIIYDMYMYLNFYPVPVVQAL